MAIPKNETICETRIDRDNNKTFVITRNINTGVFHLYKKENEELIHLKQRSSDPFFKETHPERYQQHKNNDYQL